MPGPPLLRKSRLVQDVDAGTHVGERLGRAAVRAVGDGEALVPQPLQIRLLVCDAPFLEFLEEGPVAQGRLGSPVDSVQVERGKVSAPQEVAEVRRGQHESVGSLSHPLFLFVCGLRRW